METWTIEDFISGNLGLGRVGAGRGGGGGGGVVGNQLIMPNEKIFSHNNEQY